MTHVVSIHPTLWPSKKISYPSIHIHPSIWPEVNYWPSWWSSQPHKYFIGAVYLGKWEENHFWAELWRMLKKFNFFQNQSYSRIYGRPTSYCAIMVVLTASQVLYRGRPPSKMGRKSLLGWIIENFEEIPFVSKSITFSIIWSVNNIMALLWWSHENRLVSIVI